MRRYKNTRATLVVALMVLPLFIGCNRFSSTGSANTTVGEKVELSDAKITILDAQRIRVSVKFRFVQGHPSPDAGYLCAADVQYGNKDVQRGGGDCVMVQTSGKELKDEEFVQKDFPLFKPMLPGDTLTYKFTMKKGPSAAFLNETISSVVTGNFKY
jgi:hypothetical protein